MVYTQEFKERAVRLSLDPSKTVRGVTEELGVGAGSIVRWREEMGASVARGDRNAREVRSENEELRSQLKQAEKEKRALAMEVEVLKKAAAFFARNQA